MNDFLSQCAVFLITKYLFKPEQDAGKFAPVLLPSQVTKARDLGKVRVH